MHKVYNVTKAFIFGSFYSSKNNEHIYSTVLNIDHNNNNNLKSFLEQQMRMTSEDQVTLKTAILMLKIQLWSQKESTFENIFK